MAKQSLEHIKRAQEILKSYNGKNPYIIDLKNDVYIYKIKTLNDFDVEFILKNHNNEPKYIGKIVKVADWWGEKMQAEWGAEFVPKKVEIGWFIGETTTTYAFFCRYRKSIKKGKFVVAPKNAILTDFLSDDFNLLNIDFKPYNERSGRELFPHQEEGVKFLVSKRKAILASDMGSGKSSSAIVAALEGGFKHILIISPASVKTSWHRELSHYVDEDDITIVNGSKWNDAKFTIINYEILKNFYEIPTETVKTRQLDVDTDGNLLKTYKDKEIVSRKRNIISKAMENSQLFQSKFDLIIIDEAHRLSNTSSGIYKIVSDLVKRSNPDGIFELTGTPITNDNKNLYNLLKIIGHRVTDDWENYMKRYCGAKSYYVPNEKKAITYSYCKRNGKQTWYDLNYDEKLELDDILKKTCRKYWTYPESTNSDELAEIIKTCYLRREKTEFVPLPPKEIKVKAYNLTKVERKEYEQVWDKYLEKVENPEDIQKFRTITEGSILRQWLADNMLRRTISLVEQIIKKGEKVVIFCSFDNEIAKLKAAFGDISVFHNGKLTPKKKDQAVDSFQNDDNIKIFIGNLESASVGITLTAGTNVIFNSVSFVPGINWQAEDRVHRIGQTNPCTIYYQTFNDTYLDHVMDIITGKSDNIKIIIKKETEK